MAKRKQTPTPSDAVVLSLLCEQPMHGYQLNVELERRQVRDWAGISRAQVYYSLEKLHRHAWIEPVDQDDEAAAGPERHRFATTPEGRRVLALALADEGWATQRQRPPFMTWLALSMHADSGVARKLVACRRDYLESELQRERSTLEGILADTEPIVPEPYFDSTRRRAVLMVELTIEHFEAELRWLERVQQQLDPPPDRG